MVGDVDTRAAAAGGYTTVFAMPNTSPVADTAGVVEQELALGEAAGYEVVHVNLEKEYVVFNKLLKSNWLMGS